MSTNDYKVFLATLSWDEFHAYLANANKANLTDEQLKILREEQARRANAFNNFMSF